MNSPIATHALMLSLAAYEDLEKGEVENAMNLLKRLNSFLSSIELQEPVDVEDD